MVHCCWKEGSLVCNDPSKGLADKSPKSWACLLFRSWVPLLVVLTGEPKGTPQVFCFCFLFGGVPFVGCFDAEPKGLPQPSFFLVPFVGFWGTKRTTKVFGGSNLRGRAPHFLQGANLPRGQRCEHRCPAQRWQRRLPGLRGGGGGGRGGGLHSQPTHCAEGGRKRKGPATEKPPHARGIGLARRKKTWGRNFVELFFGLGCLHFLPFK